MPKKKVITKKEKKVKEVVEKKIKKVVKTKQENSTPSDKITLIICEKPQAAEKIAAALSNNSDRKHKEKNGTAYYEFEKDGKSFIVGCAAGHLFGITQKEARGPFPNFDVEWSPAHLKSKVGYTKRFYDLLKKLAKRADNFVVSTDYDVEGEVIGWNVVRFLGGKKAEQDAKRMKFSSLTKEELQKSFENLQPTLNWSEAYSGETRHFLDWFYGINLSRGLMKALSQTGKFRILSIGRVQGPALKIVYDREIEIGKFKPTPFWQVFLTVKDKKNQFLEVEYGKNITDKKELPKFERLRGMKGAAETIIKEQKVPTPVPFDLTTLQTEAYKFFKLSPAQTSKVAQNLYLEGLISYPRTSSQKYPDINFKEILEKLKKFTPLVKYAVNEKPSEGKKTDPAHPAIHPTGELKKLDGKEKQIYELIVKRFISCFAEEAITETKKVEVNVLGIKFSAKGMSFKERNWTSVYPSNLKEKEVPTMNGEVDIKEIKIEEKMTQPPARYNSASLVKELEKRNLGTKATRANILETLYSRGYVKEQAIEVTSLGLKIVETLDKYSPIILDEQLTREFELDMEKVNNKKDEDRILEKAKKSIVIIAEGITKNLVKIGESLVEANNELIETEKKESTLSLCPVCKKGQLRIMYGKKFSRYFISCNAYPECKTTFSLPPGGMIKPVRDGEGKLEMCLDCKEFPLMLSLKKGKRPWKFCFNPNCPSRVKKEEPKDIKP
jgi:DNA topoisomerase I